MNQGQIFFTLFFLFIGIIGLYGILYKLIINPYFKHRKTLGISVGQIWTSKLPTGLEPWEARRYKVKNIRIKEVGNRSALVENIIQPGEIVSPYYQVEFVIMKLTLIEDYALSDSDRIRNEINDLLEKK